MVSKIKSVISAEDIITNLTPSFSHIQLLRSATPNTVHLLPLIGKNVKRHLSNPIFISLLIFINEDYDVNMEIAFLHRLHPVWLEHNCLQEEQFIIPNFSACFFLSMLFLG